MACSKTDICENCNFTCLDMIEEDVITNNCVENWECSFKELPKSKVDISKFDGFTVGDKNVFQMSNDTEGDLGIADDEVSRVLVFELNENQNSFSAEDGELENMNVHFRRICYCPEVEFKKVTSGCMQGEKQTDGSWFIQGNLNVPYSFSNIEIKFDAQFAN